jgi:hypothetical protein
MNTQAYLRSGKTLEDLTSELGISVTKHETLPLVILNYNQIESPKTHPIVRECRGLVLNSEDYSLVARAFGRFFNWGEVADEMPQFDWSTCKAYEKVDGCFTYNTKLNLWGGGTIKIGDVVSKHLTPTLMGMDKSGTIIPCKVTNWFDNGTKDNWLEIGLDCKISRKVRAVNLLRVTINHSIFINGRFMPAIEAKVGDCLVSFQYKPSTSVLHIIRSGLLGDASISSNGTSWKYQDGHIEEVIPQSCQITSIKNLENTKKVFPFGRKGFDIETTTNNYFAQGVLVHNSLVLIYYFDGRWHANTRGSFAGWPLFNDEYVANYYGLPTTFKWSDGFLKALGVDSLEELRLDTSITYVCEFCSLWNKVVRTYNDPCMYMLTRFAGMEEIGPTYHSNFRTLQSYPLTSVQDVQQFVTDHPEATFEGIVVKDDCNRRWKLKNPRYVALHHMKGNGTEIFKPKNLMPYILKNEGDELMTYFPEIKDVFAEYKGKVDEAYNVLETLWTANKDIPVQKDFALSIVGKTPFTSVLFNLRKQGGTLRDEWMKHGDSILKVLFK